MIIIILGGIRHNHLQSVRFENSLSPWFFSPLARSSSRDTAPFLATRPGKAQRRD